MANACDAGPRCPTCFDHYSFGKHRIDLIDPVFDYAAGLVSSVGFWFYTLNDRHFVGPFESRRLARTRRAKAVAHGSLESVQCEPLKPRPMKSTSRRRPHVPAKAR